MVVNIFANVLGKLVVVEDANVTVTEIGELTFSFASWRSYF